MIEILSIFEQSLSVELVLTSLKSIGLGQKNMMAVPLKQPPRRKKRASVPASYDGYSRIDLGFILATAFGVIGASVGFRLYWGPIIWGIAASIVGFLIGFAIESFVIKNKKKQNSAPKIIIIIRCRNDMQYNVEQILWENQSLGLAVIEC